MGEGVGYTPGTGTTVAADLVGGDLYQRVKLVIGSDGTVLGDVDVTRPMPVSGTVSVSGPMQASGTVSVSGPVQVSGTIGITNMVVVTTQASVSVSGVPVWMNPTQGVTILGTQNVAIVSGVDTVPVTTAAPSVSALGQVMRIAGGQSTTASPVFVSQINAPAGSGTISVLNVVPVTTQASVSVSGLPVWMNPTQGVTILGTQLVSVVAGTTVVSGTVSVSGASFTAGTPAGGATGQIVWVVNPGGGAATTTGAPSITEAGTPVWIVGGQGTTANPVWVSQINPPAGGGGSVTVAPPNISATGQIMWIVGGQSTTAFPVVVTGTVTAGAGTTVVSGLVSVTGVSLGVVVSGVVSISVMPAVSGNVGITNIVPVTTQASVSVSGLPVWMNPTQGVTILGTQLVSVVAGTTVVSGTVSVSGLSVTAGVPAAAATGIIMWIAGGQSSTAFPVVVTGTVTAGAGTTVVSGLVSVTGVSLGVVVSGVVSISVMPAVSGNVGITNIAPVTTQASVSVSGLPVWMNPTQGVTIIGLQSVNTIAAGFSVQALVSGVVSVSAMPQVSISGIVPVATQASVSVGGLPVWMNPTQGVTILGTQAVSQTTVVSIGAIAASMTIGTIVTVLGTLNVAQASMSFTAGTPAAGATGQMVWVVNQTAVTVTVTIAGTTTGTVSLLSIVPVTTQASVSISGIPVWFSPGATIAVSGGTTAVAVSGIVPVTTQVSVSVSGLPVWFSPGALVDVSKMLYTVGTPAQASTAQIVVNKPMYAQPVQIIVAATAVAQSANKYIFTIWTGLTGAPAAAGTTSWAVPAGKFLRLNNIQIGMTSSAVVGGSVQVFVGVGATASMISASIETQLQIMKIQIFQSVIMVSAALMRVEADVAAGESIAVFIQASTAVVSRQIVINGQLF